MFYWLTGGLATLAAAAIGIYSASGDEPPGTEVVVATTHLVQPEESASAEPVEDDTTPVGEEPEKASGTIMVANGYVANVYEAQWLSTPIVAQLGNGAEVSISCTLQGESVTANGNTSSLWNKIAEGFVPDVNVDTGTRQATMPTCP